MRSVEGRVLGLILSMTLGMSAFGSTTDRDVARGKKVLLQINTTAQFALSNVNIYKYKIAGLCKFVGQLIHASHRAESLSTKLQSQKGNEELATKLMKARGILYVANVDICTIFKTYGQPDDYDKKTEDQDANTLEQNFLELVKITAAP